MSKGQEEVSNDDPKQVSTNYKPRVPYPNARTKDRTEEQFDATSHVELNAVYSAILKNKLPKKLKDLGNFTILYLIGELTLSVGDKTITLQACNSGIILNSEGNSPHQSTKTNNMTQPTLQKLSFKEVCKPCSSNDRSYNHEEQRLRIEELDEWRVHKPRTHDKLKLRQNEFNTSPNQLKVGDKVLLKAADPHIVTTTPNDEILLTVFQPTQLGTRVCLKPWPNRRRDTTVRYGPVEAGHDFPKTRDAINPHGRATWPWVNLIGEHGRGNGKTRACQGQVSILFLRHSQMSPQGISSMLSMRMIERHRGTYPP
ncbi:hypothetical protein GOBAR_AA26040 [Gossypium barbadense]|uniref:Uncharacterized protein n=1 Tax=Gossypium barbadense TaxID=3634 RepID=A0A2P5WU91_GOSBA|nr:hypothetical protein GOBAR_AA26040 [Gossypium barbadense]